MQGSVRVTGLREVISATNKIDKGAVKQLRQTMRVNVGGPFTRDVQQAVVSAGLVKSGRLLRSFKPAVRGATLLVKSSPPLNPGPRSRLGYASIYEGKVGLLNPTLDRWVASGQLVRSMESFLDWVDQQWRS